MSHFKSLQANFLSLASALFEKKFSVKDTDATSSCYTARERERERERKRERERGRGRETKKK